jgi:hypothetical protein
MDAFEENLELLASEIVKTKNKKLKASFTSYLQSFNSQMKAYIQFIELMQKFQSGFTPQQNSENIIDFAVKK